MMKAKKLPHALETVRSGSIQETAEIRHEASFPHARV